MITFNHAKYLNYAIEGILMQKIDFQLELIIADDASPDASEDIVKSYISNCPNGKLIKYFRQERNIGMMENFIMALKECKGKYIAMCEGDDYWTDPYKLQKQVDYLEANPDFVICYHPVKVLFPDGHIEEDYLVKGIIDKSESNIYDLAVLGNYIHTPSVVFRNVLDHYPISMKNTPVGDFFLLILLAQYGRIKKMNDCMAVYRFGVGVFSSKSENDRVILFMKTLDILSEAIENKTVIAILKNRVLAMKTYKLPNRIRSLQDYSECFKPEIIMDVIPITILAKSIGKKIWRFFI